MGQKHTAEAGDSTQYTATKRPEREHASQKATRDRIVRTLYGKSVLCIQRGRYTGSDLHQVSLSDPTDHEQSAEKRSKDAFVSMRLHSAVSSCAR